PEMQYMLKRREALGGYLPARRDDFPALDIPSLDAFKAQLQGSGERAISTTMAFVRMLSALVKDKAIGERVVPIVPDEARTFGMEGMFRQLGIYSSQGQRYVPHDHDQVMFYKEDEKGQILEEGINEAGAMSAWIATATSYSTHNYAMVPFYIYYSMFGFQRVMDLIWAAGDSQARGFLVGGTAGRTTLNGEGLQHQDGHSHLMAQMVPNCRSYDPTYAYELAVIIQDGLKRMYQDKENCFYYLTVMNENYQQPPMPEGVEEGIIRGMYLLESVAPAKKSKQQLTVQLMGSGTILREVRAAAELLRDEFGIASDVWSAPSMNELRRDGLQCERLNLLHPEAEPRKPYVTQQLEGREGPVVAATDYMKSYSEQIRPYVPQRFVALGTDGYGRSDTRAKLRHHFEVDRYFITVAALKALADDGKFPKKDVTRAIEKFGIDPDKTNPLTA
ncbi:MAG: pyruvate dehydrogenase (acetyl-transferring), homodimeric type, partial [Spongiibacteraceae bacterium]|nr:pyruvate dehydrogenase (acetyl-transferring), homodimeric type [Spongiibacteraceae bacterium]